MLTVNVCQKWKRWNVNLHINCVKGFENHYIKCKIYEKNELEWNVYEKNVCGFFSRHSFINGSFFLFKRTQFQSATNNTNIKKYFAKQSINSKSGLILDIPIMFTEWHIGLIYKTKYKYW